MIGNFNSYKQIENPEMFLCNPDRRFISAINASNRHLVLRFNDLSELTFSIYENTMSPEDYARVQTKRMIFLDKIGWFKITSVDEKTVGDVSYKSIIAESEQSAFKDRGFVTENRVYMFYNPKNPTDSLYNASDASAIPSVVGQLFQQLGIRCQLPASNTEPTVMSDYDDWTIVWIDSGLRYNTLSSDNICRTFEAKTSYGYDFMAKTAAEAFDVVFDFDILHHAIKIKFTANLTQTTNIYLSFDNLLNEINYKEKSDEIVTVLSCDGKDLDIRTVNPMGTNYICNFDYYKKALSEDGKIPYPWMSESLINALDDWKDNFDAWQEDDNTRTGHTKGYSSIVAQLQGLYAQQATYREEIQKSNLILKELSSARDQYNSATTTDKETVAKYPVVVETVNNNTKSKLSTSSYHTTGNEFAPSKTITAYTNPPAVAKEGNVYKYTFSGTATTGTAASMIGQSYIDSTVENVNSEVPFYFSDDSSRQSYCKLLVASSVDVAKDANGVSKAFSVNDSGTVSLNNTTFTVTKTSATTYSITVGGSTITPDVNGYFSYNGVRYRVTESTDNYITVYCYYVSGFDRYSTYFATTGTSGWCHTWESYIASVNTSMNTLNAAIKTSTDELAYINRQCNIETYIKGRGTSLYNELMYYWIEGEYTNDNLAVLDNTSMEEQISLAKELMDAGEKELERVSQPSFEMNVSAIDFTKIYEFRKFSEELALGKKITIEKEDGVHYTPALLAIELDLDSPGNFSLTFSNAFTNGDTAMSIADMLNKSTSTSRTVAANWSNLTRYDRERESIDDLLKNPLDTTLRMMQSNLANQEFTIDTTGILGRKWADDTHDSFANEQLRIINNVIMFTDDAWETSKLALGKISYGNNQTAYGIAAEVLVGDLIMGSTLRIKNSNSSVTIDENGIIVKNGSGTTIFSALVDGGLTSYGYATIDALNTVDGKFANYAKKQIYTKCNSSTTGAKQVVANSATPTSSQIKLQDVQATGATGISVGDYVVLSNVTTEQAVSSLITQTADSITLSVSQTYATQSSLDTVDGKFANYAKKQIYTKCNSSTTGAKQVVANSATPTSSQIKLQDVQATGATGISVGDYVVLSNVTTEQAVSGQLSLYVTKTDNNQIVSMLNASADIITISSNRLTITSDNFSLAADGTITAKTGTIANFNIISNSTKGTYALYYRHSNNSSYDGFILGRWSERDSNKTELAFGQVTIASDGAATINPTTYISSQFIETPHIIAKKIGVSNRSMLYSGADYNTRTAKLTISGTQVIINIYYQNSSTTVALDHDQYFDIKFTVPYNNTTTTLRTAITVTAGTSQATIDCDSGSSNPLFEINSSNQLNFPDIYRNTAHNFLSRSNIIPFFDDAYDLGSSEFRWDDIYATNGTIQTSDRLLKKDINVISEKYSQMFDMLSPVTFARENGKSGRTHIGLIAQDLKQAIETSGLTTKECAAYVEWEDDNGGIGCGIRYEELIALNISEIQKLKKRVQELEEQLKEQKE